MVWFLFAPLCNPTLRQNQRPSALIYFFLPLDFGFAAPLLPARFAGFFVVPDWCLPCVATGVSCSTAPAVSCVGPASAAGFLRSVFPLAVLLGCAPSVRISVTRSKVNSCRCPRLRREFF